MIEINSLKCAIALYKKYQKELKSIDRDFIRGTLDISEGDRGVYVLKVEAFPKYSISIGEISMKNEIEEEWYRWEVANRKAKSIKP